MGVFINMFVTQFYIGWIVFVYTKISADLVSNDIHSSGDYGLVKEIAQMKDPKDFRFSKFLDFRFDVEQQPTDDMLLSLMNRDQKGEKEKINQVSISDISELLKNIEELPTEQTFFEKKYNIFINVCKSVCKTGNFHILYVLGIQNQEMFSKNLKHQDRLDADNNSNKYLLKKLYSLTDQIKNITEMMIKINGEITGIRKNISHLSEDQMSFYKGIRNDRCSIWKSSNGVTYNGVYPRIERGETKDNQTVSIPTDCKEVQNRGNLVSGVHEIQPKLSPKPFLVLCDMETRGGGWTHIQKRFDGSQDFYLGWREYKFGFGDLDGEFWLGLENIYFLTSVGAELLIEVVDLDHKTSYAHYGTFKIGSEPDGYPLSNLTNFSGDAGDSLTYHLGQKFSTKDYDQDEHSSNCAEQYFGAWWYKACHFSNLNGKYINLKVSGKYVSAGPEWNQKHSLAKTRMMVRKTSVQ